MDGLKTALSIIFIVAGAVTGIIFFTICAFGKIGLIFIVTSLLACIISSILFVVANKNGTADECELGCKLMYMLSILVYIASVCFGTAFIVECLKEARDKRMLAVSISLTAFGILLYFLTNRPNTIGETENETQNDTNQNAVD